MERFIKIVIEYENGLEFHLEGIKGSICFDPENNELEFKNAGNGRVKFNTLYMKRIFIDGKLVKGYMLYYR